jgi:hypothetical protein
VGSRSAPLEEALWQCTYTSSEPANDRFWSASPKAEIVGVAISEIWHTSTVAVGRLLDAARAGEYLE